MKCLPTRCNARGLKSKGKVRADELLLQYVEEYFSAGSTHREGKLRSTRLGPLYFQHPGKPFSTDTTTLLIRRTFINNHWIREKEGR